MTLVEVIHDITGKNRHTHRQLLTGNNLNIHQRAVNSKAQVAELEAETEHDTANV